MSSAIPRCFDRISRTSGHPAGEVTRTHPPGDGDATDHATMHPGVWLAFGNISGEDFWRNKARIGPGVHRRTGSSRGPAHVCHRKPSHCSRRDAARHTAVALCLRPARGTCLPADVGIGDPKRVDASSCLAIRRRWGGVRVATNITELKGGIVVNSDGLSRRQNRLGQTGRLGGIRGRLGDAFRGSRYSPRCRTRIRRGGTAGTMARSWPMGSASA